MWVPGLPLEAELDPSHAFGSANAECKTARNSSHGGYEPCAAVWAAMSSDPRCSAAPRRCAITVAVAFPGVVEYAEKTTSEVYWLMFPVGRRNKGWRRVTRSNKAAASWSAGVGLGGPCRCCCTCCWICWRITSGNTPPWGWMDRLEKTSRCYHCENKSRVVYLYSDMLTAALVILEISYIIQ